MRKRSHDQAVDILAESYRLFLTDFCIDMYGVWGSCYLCNPEWRELKKVVNHYA